MKHRKFLQRLFAVLLSAALLIGCVPPLAARGTEAEAQPEASAAAPESLWTLLQQDAPASELELQSSYAPTDRVRVIVELEDAPLLESDAYADADAMQAQINSLAAGHEQIKARIRSLSGDLSTMATGEETQGYDYYLVLNGFSIETEYQYLDEIRALTGVKRAFVEQSYALPEVEPNMGTSTGMIGSTAANESGYTGEGMVVAVLDTGLDVSHVAFATAPTAPKYSYEDMEALLNSQQLSARRATLTRVFVSEKIPYVYDYADMDTDVYPYGGDSHGTHVSGTVAADCEELTGVAPKAQLMMLKVFSDDGSAYDSGILAALDDAVKLGADVINMSLGAAAGFTEAADQATREAYERIRAAGINLAISAGNNTSAALNNSTGVNLPYATDPDYGIVGAPSTYEAAMSVASAVNLRIDNSPYLLSHDRQIFFTDVSGAADPKLWDLNGTYSYIYCNYGRPEDFETAGYVQGKVALISRGENSFTEKVTNAYNAGAIAVIVMNNQSGTIAMAVDEYLIPAVSITQADGNFLRDRADCKVSFSPDYFGTQENPAAGQLSSFSSWGVTSDLKLKPEITAPGENIWSTSLYGGYELMSGTSMASPHIAGAFAVVKQYLKETYPDKTARELYDLANALLMSTATPAVDPNGQFYSPRQQGAGLANIADAIQSPVYLSVSTSDKPKAELGDNEKGYYAFGVTLNNLSDEARTYTAETAALIENVENGLFTGYCQNYAGSGIAVSYAGLDAQGTVTVPAGGSATVTVVLQVSPELREQALALAPNGTYVDGFVRFVSEDDVDLTLPFLGFLGNWAKADVFEVEYTEGDYHLRPSIVFNADSSNMTYLGMNVIHGLLTGEVLIDTDRYVISPSSYMNYCTIVSTQTGILRSAEKLTYTITSKETGTVLREFSYENVGKSYYHQSAGQYVWAEAFMYDIPYFDGYDQYGRQASEGTYTYTVTALPVGAKASEAQSWSFDFEYDATPAQVEHYELFEQDGKPYIRLVISDNFFLSGVQIGCDADLIGGQTATIDPDRNADSSYVTNADGDRLYTVEFDLSYLCETLEARGLTLNTLQVDLFDYAMNVSSVALKLRDAEPQSVELDRSAAELVPGMQTQLKAEVAPADAAGYTLQWTSSDPAVATVSETGLVTARTKGSVVITVTAGTATASCAVSVVPNTGIAIDPTAYTLTQGETLYFQAAVLPEYGSAVFSSSDETVASVSSDGVLTALLPGTVTITATSTVDPAVTATATIQVLSAQPDFVIVDGVLTAYTGTDTEIVIPDGVKKIGSNILSWNSAVRKVTIPASVTEIGDYAFSYKSSLEEVVILGSNLEKIGNSAFASTYLSEITLPASVRSIGNSAFSYCYYLTEANLAPSGLEYLGSYAFANTALLAIDIPETVTYIGDYCFSQTLLSEVVIPDTVTYLGSSVFFYCQYLESAVLPESLETLKHSTFWYCGSLTHLELPKDLKTLEDSALYGIAVRELKLPDTLETIGAYALADNLYTKIELPPNVKTLGNNALQGSWVATEIILNENLESIGNNAFQACYALEKLYIGKSLSSVGTDLFKASDLLAEIVVNEENPNFKAEDGLLCSKDGKIVYGYAPGRLAQSLTLPETVEEIRPYTFANHMDLEEVILPEGLKTIGQEAFAGAQSLKTVEIPDSVTSLGYKAFAKCPALEQVTIGSGVTEIPAECFADNNSLRELNLSSGLQTIRNGAFDDADAIVELTIPEGVTTIEYSAFLGCDSLRTANLPASLSSMGSSAFNLCVSMEEFVVDPASATYASKDGVLFSAGYETLLNYPAAKTDVCYTAPEGVKTVSGYAFYETLYLEELTLPEGVTKLSDTAIYYCESLRVVNLPDSLESVGFLGLAYTGIETLTLGKNLKTLGMMAFACNLALRLVDMSRCENLSLGGSTFSVCDALTTVIGGSGVTYLGWGEFGYPQVATVYAPTDSALLTYAINNGMPYVECTGFTVIPDPEQTMLTLGESLKLNLYTLSAEGEPGFTLTLRHKATGQEIMTQTADTTAVTLTPPCAGVLELVVTARDAAGNEAVSLPVTLSVGDGTPASYDWKTGAYLTTADLLDLQQKELLPEDATLSDVLLTADSQGLTATLSIEGATALGLWVAETMTEIKPNADGSFTLPVEQAAMTVTITYGETQVTGTLRLDLAGAVYQPARQEQFPLAEGYYETTAALYYNDWEQVSPATAFLKGAWLRMADGVCNVILELQPWTQADGTVVALEGLSLVTADGIVDAERVETEDGAVYLCAALPETVAFTDVLLEYNDVSGSVELPRVAKLYIDFAAAAAAEHISTATERQNARKATCTEDGYTGDLVCRLCGEVLEQGEVIPAHCPSAAFGDLNTAAWYHEYTDYVIANGLMAGMGDNSFAPNGTVTRAMIVTTLYRMAGEPEVTGNSTFADVQEGQWYTEAVLWAEANGVAKGLSETSFGPNVSVTREQAAVFLYRYVTLCLGETPVEGADLTVFGDSDTISAYATEAMAWALAEGLFTGFEDGTIRAKETLSRVQLAKLLTVLDQRF